MKKYSPNKFDRPLALELGLKASLRMNKTVYVQNDYLGQTITSEPPKVENFFEVTPEEKVFSYSKSKNFPYNYDKTEVEVSINIKRKVHDDIKKAKEAQRLKDEIQKFQEAQLTFFK